MYLYILISALYRLSCGALIIAVNWLMVVSNASLGWLAVTVALTFIPAMIVPLIWKNKSPTLSGKKLTQFSLLAGGVISMLMSVTENQYILLGMNTVIWFFFFIMESSWESWFASECQGLSNREIERYSSVSMSANQAALMAGPVVAASVFGNEPGKVILLCSAIYLVCFVAIWLSGSGNRAEASQPATGTESNGFQRLNITGTEISLLLIWPTLAMFNFMLPAQVVSFRGSMTEVGLLDALMGIGMIVSGLLVAHAGIYKIIIKYKLTLAFLIAAMLLWILGGNLLCRLISVFLLGLSFNSQRIVIRGRLATKYEPVQVGKLVSGANSFSFIIISLSLLFFHSDISFNWAIPFIFSLIIGCIIPFEGKINAKVQREPSGDKGEV